MTVVDRPAPTVTEVDDDVEGGVPGEVLKGEFTVSGSTTPRHNKVVQRLLLQLLPQLPPGWMCLTESVAWVVERDVDQPRPDLMVVPEDIDGGVAEVTVTPAFVAEVLSPATGGLDLTTKRDVYARGGAPYVAVDHLHGEVHLFLVDGTHTLHTGGSLAVAGVVPLVLDLDSLLA